MSAWEGSQWQLARDAEREQIKRAGKSGCGHPGCEIEDRPPQAIRCVLDLPMHLSVPAGTHIHIDCPVHGAQSHVIRGSGLTL